MPDGKPLHGLVWPQWSAFPDFTNPKARAWWGGYYARLLDAGIAGIWHDMNEPVSFAVSGETNLPRAVVHDMEGRGGGEPGGSHEEAHNLYGLLMGRTGFEALRTLRPERRPWLLTRSGWAGIQRYSWHWTGDVESSWAALRMTIATVLGLGLSGVAYSGPDIGGFSGAPDAELFTRWFQMATLMPFFRSHAAVHTPRREPWSFGEPTLSICRDFLQLRQRLLPYLYSLSQQASETGAPLNRPLFWQWPEEQFLWGRDDAFMLGDDLLVAPMLEARASQRAVALPPGGWYDFWDGRFYAGGETVMVAAPIEKIPLFVRAGCVLPQQIDGLLHLKVYPALPGADVFTSQHYADAGDGYGPSRLDRFAVVPLANGLRIKWTVAGDYRLPEQVTVAVAGQPAARFVVDGQAVEVVDGKIVSGRFQELKIKW